MRKLLVPIDGSKASERALQTAIDLCKGRENDYLITLLHVSVIEYHYAGIGIAAVRANIDESIVREGDHLLRTASNQFENSGIEVDTVHLQGYAAQEICQYAEENRYDMIVIGNRGLGTFGKFILGSVSHKVVHHASCPVLIVK
ncbi:universal stress protein [Fictibacillus sp. Mic-4]|uniref:universal stress protein n=1 Tax=Fictibacillus sp. Mic-4 TaxID=3132826 RepID=UPI003CF72E42